MTEAEQASRQARKKELRALIRLFVEMIAGCILISATVLYGYHLRGRVFPAPCWVSFFIPFGLAFLLYLKSFIRLMEVAWWLYIRPRRK
ncbi:MAG: hypothetical protein HYV18_03175 [Gammaproteobacteria bacterium]|nr:hypothetical protein [Gammaproteobacteria bacterium]